jgi:YjbE family integral membrane protein
MEFANLFAPGALTILLQVIMIDAVLAGDNAIVVGSLAAGLPADQRKKVIAIGIGAALVLRIAFALVVTQLLEIVGLVLAGGLLLMWVAWRMYRDLQGAHTTIDVPESDLDPADFKSVTGARPAKSFAAAAWSVAIADVSMSLDNVLAVAGAAHEHPEVMIVGLLVSVALMGVAANFIAKYIERYRWIAWIGLAVIVYVAGKMIWEGWHDVAPVVRPLIGG